MESKNYIYTLRQKLGLTAKELATLIDCNMGQVAMAEIGQRNLPAQSNLLLRYLELSLEEAEKNTTNTEEYDEDLKNKLANQIRFFQLKRDELVCLLEQSTEKVNALRAFLKTISLLKTEELAAYSEMAHLQMQILKSKAIKKLKLFRLQMLEQKIKIAGLSAEIAEAEKFI